MLPGAQRAGWGSLQLEVELLRGQHLWPVRYALVLLDRILDRRVKHAWARQDGDFLHHPVFDQNLRLDHAFSAVLNGPARHLGCNLGRAGHTNG